MTTGPAVMERIFDFNQAEPEIYAAWEASGAFRAGANAKPGAESFCIMLPPPNVTGSLHLGHAFNHTLMDVLIRWHRMRGFDTLWQPGLDHAGIATQAVVERELAAAGEPTRREMGREPFLEKVWAWKEQSGGRIVEQDRRLGATMDWSRSRFTMDAAFQDLVTDAFVELYERGLIYKSSRLVNWDPVLRTAISDLEVENVEIDGHLWHFRYPLENGLTYEHPVQWAEDGGPIAFETRDYIVVATGRPETMLGDTGIAVHPDDDRYRTLIGRRAVLPLVGRSIPIVADPHADAAKGTGAVKITPAHDFNDWAVGRRADLRVVGVIDLAGRIAIADNAEFLAGCAPSQACMALQGLDRTEARHRVVGLAQQQGWLDRIVPERQTIPHGDRSKSVIEPLLTDQWFVDAAKLAGPALDAVRSGRTRILPEREARAYIQWLENIEPWCVSRQLWWGHQIPVWYDADGHAFCARSEAEARAAAGDRPLTRDESVLDTWFSSGLWPAGTLGWPAETEELERYFPTNMLITGFDIIFFWVARMMMMHLALVGDVPFRTAYVHALIRDEQGRKMSKSAGNIIDPIVLIDQHGTDAVRFTLTAMATIGRDLKLSVDKVASSHNFVTKLWNAARFAELNACEIDPDFDPRSAACTHNRWIIGATARIGRVTDDALASYRFGDAAAGLYDYVWGTFCNWYLEFSKPFLQGEASPARTETRATLAWALDQCLLLLHPIMPFVTERIWSQGAKRAAMLIVTDWPTYGSDLEDARIDTDVAWLIRLIEQVRSLRSEFNVKPGVKTRLVLVDTDDDVEERLRLNWWLVSRLAWFDALERAERPPKASATLSLPGAVVCLPLEGVMDLAAERARVAKAFAALDIEIGATERRLSNVGFIASAPEAIVAENKRRLRDARGRRDRLAEVRAVMEELFGR